MTEKSPRILKVCVCVICYQSICQEKWAFKTPFHISSHLLYSLILWFFFFFVCSPLRLKKRKMHHLKAIGSHSLPIYQAKVTGRLGLLEYLLYTRIIKNVLLVNHLCCLFFHPSSKEFNETGKMDVQDGCRSDSSPFFTEQMEDAVLPTVIQHQQLIVLLIVCDQSHVLCGFWIYKVKQFSLSSDH